MRIFIACLLLTSLFSCGSRTETTDDLSDTLAVDTTIIIPDVDIDTTMAMGTELKPLQLALNELTKSRNEKIETLYQLELNASGYEYQTNATWYFDSLFLLGGRVQKWSSEGAEGESEHFFQLDKLFAFSDHTSTGSSDKTYTQIFHRGLGGLKFEEEDTLSPTGIVAMEPDAVSQEEADLKRQLREIINSLREHEDEINEAGSGVTLVLSKKVAYGKQTFNETSEISLGKILLKKLLE